MFEDKMTKKINENVLFKYGARHFAYTLKNCFARKRTCKIETEKIWEGFTNGALHSSV